MEFDTPQQRIRYIFEQTGQTQKEFAEVLGIGQPHLCGIMSTRKASRRLILTIAQRTGANADWIEMGQGDVYTDPTGGEGDPPELANVISEARGVWPQLEQPKRYDLAATLLREIRKPLSLEE